MQRRRKTNKMLITVSVIFFLSWAPLNILNIVIDTFEPFDNSEEDKKVMLMLFAGCHLSAMTSVCSNPIMYGFLNENFKQSLAGLFSRVSCLKHFFMATNVRKVVHNMTFEAIKVEEILNPLYFFYSDASLTGFLQLKQSVSFAVSRTRRRG